MHRDFGPAIGPRNVTNNGGSPGDHPLSASARTWKMPRPRVRAAGTYLVQGWRLAAESLETKITRNRDFLEAFSALPAVKKYDANGVRAPDRSGRLGLQWTHLSLPNSSPRLQRCKRAHAGATACWQASTDSRALPPPPHHLFPTEVVLESGFFSSFVSWSPASAQSALMTLSTLNTSSEPPV